jgi:hypothetical protein
MNYDCHAFLLSDFWQARKTPDAAEKPEHE